MSNDRFDQGMAMRKSVLGAEHESRTRESRSIRAASWRAWSRMCNLASSRAASLTGFPAGIWEFASSMEIALRAGPAICHRGESPTQVRMHPRSSVSLVLLSCVARFPRSPGALCSWCVVLAGESG